MPSETEFVNYKDFVESLDEASDFSETDKSVVSNNANGPRSMPQTTADKIVAQRTLAGNIAPAFIPSDKPNPTTTVAGYPYMYGGSLYVAKVGGYQGPWDADKFVAKDIGDFVRECVNSLGATVEFSAVSGSAVSLRTPIKVRSGDKILFKIDGADGIISQNKMNFKLYLGGSVVQYSDSTISGFNKWYEITATSNADEFEVERDSAIGSGNLTLSVFVKGALYYKVLDDFAASYEQMDDKANTSTFSATVGNPVFIDANLKVKAGDKVRFIVKGADGIISQNTMNVYLFSGSTQVYFGDSTIRAFGVWYEMTAPADADRIAVDRGSAIGSGTLTMAALVEGVLYGYIINVIEKLNDSIVGIRNDIDGYRESTELSIGTPTTGYAYDRYGDLFANAESSYSDITIDSSSAGKALNVTLSSATNNSRYVVLCDDNGVVKEYVSNGMIATAGGSYDFETVPQVGWTLKVSWRTANGTPVVSSVVDYPSILEKTAGLMYVSSSGDDDNAGTRVSPKQTVSGAIRSGAKSVILLEGVYEDNSLDLSKCVGDKVTIKGEEGKQVIFKKSDSKLVDDGSETLVAGYSHVYSVPMASEPSYSTGYKWLFFDGLADENTAIDLATAHPMERGLFYRNDCTKIVKCSSATLADALDEIESATDYRWFFDSGKLYFNRAASTSAYPIYKSVGNYLVTRPNQSVLMTNIEFRYGCVNLIGLNHARIENVSAKYVYGAGCFQYDNSIGIEFVRCEASSAFFGWRGDGFNGHATGSPADTAKCCNAVITDCWAHDCADDGYSDHEYGETTINGGLYEYNGKAGVAPSYGSHCVCNNVYSRHNRIGFYYPGEIEDHGNGGQVICYGCVAESNDLNLSSDNAGFRVSDADNRMILVNCKSINDHYAFRVGANSYMEVIDCGCVGAYRDTDVSETGTLVKVKTSILE